MQLFRQVVQGHKQIVSIAVLLGLQMTLITWSDIYLSVRSGNKLHVL